MLNSKLFQTRTPNYARQQQLRQGTSQALPFRKFSLDERYDYTQSYEHANSTRAKKTENNKHPHLVVTETNWQQLLTC
jgi:hypothetical protein